MKNNVLTYLLPFSAGILGTLAVQGLMSEKNPAGPVFRLASDSPAIPNQVTVPAYITRTHATPINEWLVVVVK